MMQQDDPFTGYRPSAVALESVRMTLDLYRSGKSGILYSKLLLFVQPILTHYQIELDVDFTDDVTPDNLEDMTLLLDILETATSFWEYCSLNTARKAEAYNDLQESLLGPEPSPEELLQFPVLVASMETQWDALSAGEPFTPVFISPLDTNLPSPESDPFTGHAGALYGPENLDIPDAFALFARPLLDNEALYEDPESLDETMTKAQAYWDLAHKKNVDLAHHLDALASTFCTSSFTKEQLKLEAQQMIQRFHELFPEHK